MAAMPVYAYMTPGTYAINNLPDNIEGTAIFDANQTSVTLKFKGCNTYVYDVKRSKEGWIGGENPRMTKRICKDNQQDREIENIMHNMLNIDNMELKTDFHSYPLTLIPIMY